MGGLCFPFAELVREAKAFKVIARQFLDSSTIDMLDVLANQLQAIWSARGGEVQQLELKPLRTNANEGAHERGDRRGPLNIYAVLQGTWEVTPLGAISKKKKGRDNREMIFSGKASMKIELYEYLKSVPRLAMWRQELGDRHSPGCYFHAQILGDSNDPPFPKSMPVPRLPSFFVTPISAIEYVLGELFQDQWAEKTGESTDDVSYWRALQTRRLKSLFSWYQKTLDTPVKPAYSPWMTLKAAKPEARMFVCKQ